MATGTGSVELDFGVAPGGTVATVAVAGQASILATDHVGVWFMAESSTDYNAEAHRYIFLNFVGLIANAPTPAVGFTITATSLITLVGKIKCRWGWSS